MISVSKLLNPASTIAKVLDWFYLNPKAKISEIEIELRAIEDSEKKVFHFKIKNGFRRVKNCTVWVESEERNGIYGKKNIGSLKPLETFEADACRVREEKVQNLTFKFEVNGYPQEEKISL
jgi:hypothetical protein